MKLFFTTIILLVACNLFAQQVRVLSKTDRQPISNCSVYNADKTIVTTTDKNGIADVSKFKLVNAVIFSHIGFQTQQISYSTLITLGEILLSEAAINLKEVVLSANKVEESVSDLPVKVDIIPMRQIFFANPISSADMLQQSGKVYVQQSQLGGGSPVIRGMESSRVLMVVDGVRMNNAIYRAGHLQNIITIDPNMLERAEVVHGPGSVIYGSDALGGVMHFYTLNPSLSSGTEPNIQAKTMLRYSTAAGEFSQSLLLNAGWKKTGFVLGVTHKNVGDLREGKNRIAKYGDWGKSLYYAGRDAKGDVMVANDNSLIQKHSGYEQYDLLGKLLWQPNNWHRFMLNVQFSNSGDVPRYDRLTEMNAEKLKYAEWYYGPQTRLLVSPKFEFLKPSKLYDHAVFTAAWQYISEDRISRSFGKTNKKHQEETVKIASLNADFLKQIFGKSELRYGFEGNINFIDSKAYNENIKTGTQTFDAATRYPDAGDRMSSISAYASNNWEISEHFIFSQGIRLNYTTLYAEYTKEMMALIKFPFDAVIKQKNPSITGSLGIIATPRNGWRIAANLSSGFRSPNIDDLSKLNDSNSKDRAIIVPNPELSPEYAYNAELTLGKTFAEKLQVEITGFYSLLKDAFSLRASRYNGNDSIVFDGVKSKVFSLQNSGKAFITGIEAILKAQLCRHAALNSNLTYTYGRLTSDNVPLDHIPPLFGATSIKTDWNKFTAELYVNYSGWKRIKNYSPSGEDNETYATPDGMPAWFTLNLRTGYNFHQFVNLQFGIENILDRHYRYFASGISAPGRNFIFTLRSSF